MKSQKYFTYVSFLHIFFFPYAIICSGHFQPIITLCFIGLGGREQTSYKQTTPSALVDLEYARWSSLMNKRALSPHCFFHLSK